MISRKTPYSWEVEWRPKTKGGYAPSVIVQAWSERSAKFAAQQLMPHLGLPDRACNLEIK